MAVKEAVVRPIHQRRVAIATVTDILRVNANTHPETTRELVAYDLLLENVDTTEAAYMEPT